MCTGIFVENHFEFSRFENFGNDRFIIGYKRKHIHTHTHTRIEVEHFPFNIVFIWHCILSALEDTHPIWLLGVCNICKNIWRLKKEKKKPKEMKKPNGIKMLDFWSFSKIFLLLFVCWVVRWLVFVSFQHFIQQHNLICSFQMQSLQNKQLKY